MKLIIGLGNPGKEYKNTRHNIGFMFMEKYANKKNISTFNAKFNGEMATFNQNGEKVILFKPLTYMNLSGTAISQIVSFYNILLDDIVVIYDDKDLPFASLRLREKGNPGSHNGMKNITECLHSNDYKRIRVGIGKPEYSSMMKDYVLSNFSSDELKELDVTFEDICKACDLFIENKFSIAMNNYNKKNGSTI